MAAKVKGELLHDHNLDGIDRRGFLKCYGVPTFLPGS